MKLSLVGILILIPGFLLGCNDKNSEEEVLTANMFKEQMLKFTDDDSIDCGDVYIEIPDDDEVFMASQCAFDAYTLALPFHIFQRLDGLHTPVYYGYVFDGKTFYDGNYWDPEETPPVGEINIKQCQNVSWVSTTSLPWRFGC